MNRSPLVLDFRQAAPTGIFLLSSPISVGRRRRGSSGRRRGRSGRARSLVDDVVQLAVSADKGLPGRGGEERRFRLALAVPGAAVDDARRDRVDPDGREVRGEVAGGEVDRTVRDPLDDRPGPGRQPTTPAKSVIEWRISKCLATRIGPITLASNAAMIRSRSNSAIGASWGSEPRVTTWSTAPSCAAAAAIVASSVRSRRTAPSIVRGSRAPTNTSMPSCRARVAIAAPMPRPPPITRSRCPLSSVMRDGMLWIPSYCKGTGGSPWATT